MATSTNDPNSVKAASQYGGVSSFPSELTGSPVHFNISIISYSDSPGFTSNKVGSPKYSVYLPLPEGLMDNFHVEYEDSAMGIFGGIVSTTKGIINDPHLIAGAVESSLKRMAMATPTMGASALAAGLGSYAESGGKYSQQAKAVSGMLSNAAGTIQNAVELTAGSIVNPNIAVLFKGINIRRHHFKWRFTCKNVAEYTTLQGIIKSLKVSSLPTLDNGVNLLLDYPDVAMLSLSGLPDGTVNFSKFGTFIENISASYGGGNIPLFAGNYAPVEVILEISFRERNIMTAEDIK